MPNTLVKNSSTFTSPESIPYRNIKFSLFKMYMAICCFKAKENSKIDCIHLSTIIV